LGYVRTDGRCVPPVQPQGRHTPFSQLQSMTRRRRFMACVRESEVVRCEQVSEHD
jgi:hypothetical protein